MPTWVQAYLTASQPFFYPVVFIALYASGLGAPISADLVLLTVGYIAYQGHADYVTLVVLSISAIMATDATLFLIARKYGRSLLSIWPFRKVVTPERLDSAEGSYRSYGYRMIFAARFMPGIRTVFVFTGGLLKLDLLKFMLHDFAGALIVVPCTIYSVKWVAGNLEAIHGHMAKAQNFVLLGVTLAVFVVFLRNRSRASSRTR
jgi:membrane protein DedA with SNARE-associated domain